MSRKQKRIVWPELMVLLVLLGALAFGAGRPRRLAEPDEEKPNVSDSTFSRALASKGRFALLEPQGNGYAYQRALTIDHTKVPNTDQANFPVLVSGTYPYLATVANGGNVQNAYGYDVIFTSDSGCATKLNHEVESYYSATGTVNYWVNVPTVSHTSDSVFYLCYGNAGISTDQSNKTAVWDGNYKGVWHLPNGTGLTTTDSTANANHSSSNSALATAGVINGAASYNGAGQSTVISNPWNFDLEHNQAFSVEFWLKKPLDTVTNQILISKKNTYWTGAGFDVWTWAGSNNAIFDLMDSAGTWYQIGSNVNVQDNVWHHIVCTYDGSSNRSGMKMYVDGTLTSAGSPAAIPNTIRNPYNLTFGTNSVSQYDYLNGSLDEVRFSSSSRSADWIRTAYNSQSSPSTFYTISTSGGNQPAISRVNVTSNSVLGQTISLAKPANVLSGDILIAIVASSFAYGGVPTPAGWTLIQSVDQGSQIIHVDTYYRVVNGSEPPSWIWQLGSPSGNVNARATGSIIAYRGINTTAPITATNTQCCTAGTSTSVASINTPTANNLVLAVFAEGQSDSAYTPPPGLTGVVNVTNGDPNWGNHHMVGERLLATAGSTGDQIATNGKDTGSDVAQLIALQGAGGSSGTDTVWVEDAVPAGAAAGGDAESWNWIGSSPGPISGSLSHQSNVVSGLHQHYFYYATSTLTVNAGDKLFSYVYLDPANVPSEVMLQWYDGGWEHRAYWGANNIGWGTNGTDSRRYMGALPAAGGWVRQEVAASAVGLEGHTLNGMAFTLWGGRATWDRAGKSIGPPTTGLAGFWKFDENNGTSAADSSASGIHGTLQNGPTWTTGQSGAALNFDGSDDFVSSSGLANVTNNFTLSFWALPSATHEIDPETTPGFGGVAGQRYAFWPAWYADGHCGAGVSVGTNGVSVYEHAANYMPATLVHSATLSGWTHITIVYENRQPRLYLNGILAKTGLTSPMSYVHMNPTYMGGPGYGYYAGKLDEVRVYNRALTATEVATLPNSSGSSNQPPVASAGGPYSGTAGTAVQFNGGGSSDPDGTIASYVWNFGDGGTASGNAPSHTYTAAGTYNVTLTVTDNGNLTASASTTATIQAPAPPHAATFISQTVPTSMVPGQSYNVSVTMQNTGSNTWTAANLYRLGSQNPPDNWIWNNPRINVPTTVAPGGQAVFNFNVTAPSTAGTYNFQWRMLQEGVIWFGDLTPNVVVNVANAGPTATNVVWTNVSSTIQVNGNSLAKIGGTNQWDAGAVSTQTLSGNGYVEFTPGHTSTWRMCGLGSVDSSPNYDDIEFAFYLDGGGNLYVFESGQNRGYFGAYTGTDTLKVASESGVVKYYRNGTLIYTSALTPQYPLLVDTSLNTQNSTLYQLTNVVIFGSTSAGGPPTTGLVGYWKFDENSSTIANDSSGSGNTGTLASGASWMAGQSGSAANFDGVDDYVQVGPRPSLVMSNAASFSAWIYPTGNGSGIIINKENEYEIARFSDGSIQWAFANTNPGWAWINTGYVASLNQWAHVALTYDNGLIKTYINGALTHTYSGAGTIVGGPYDFRIGGRQCCVQNFPGRIDEVRVYNRALTVTEVATLPNGSGSSNQPPVASAGGPYSGTAGTAVQFNGSGSSDPDGTITSYQWTFGDNTSGTGANPTHTYATANTYTVTLTVTDNSGVTGSVTTTTTVTTPNQAPVANAGGPYSGAVGTAVQFNGSGSSDPNGSIASYAWNFGDGGTGSGATPSHTYTATGTYNVTLTVTDNGGLTANAVTTVSPAAEVIDVRWDPTNRDSIDDPDNDRGSQQNRAEGNNNFQLVAPVLSLPGRGVDVNLNLVYNSLVWNKAGTEMAYDIDQDTPAPGWQLGFGKMVSMGTAGALIIEPDGTRHSFKGTVFDQEYPSSGGLPAFTVPTFKGRTIDGSLIEYRLEGLNGAGQPRGVARYPDGTVVWYTNYSTDFSVPHTYLYPYSITDANGNLISIKYLWDLREPRLERIVDSLGRVISFHYDSQKRLTSITAPGLADASGNPTTQTFVRLHYATKALGIAGAFTNLATRVRNTSPALIDAIYYPGTGTGYWLPVDDAYSSYGMLTKVTEQRGMGFSAGANSNEQGTITQGTMTRQQVYDYPTTPSGLSAAPTFPKVTETWDGGTAPAITMFAVQNNSAPNESTITITRPDGTKGIEKSFSFSNPPDSDPNKFKDGLLKEEQTLDANGRLLHKTILTWEESPDKTPRLQRTETTDERGGVVITDYDQFGTNNSVGRVRERDYDGSIIRTTLNTFISYDDRDIEDLRIDEGRTLYHPRRINLVESVKLFEGDESANKLAAYTEYRYDVYATPLQAYAPDYLNGADLFAFGEPRQAAGITGILQHSGRFNPMPFNSTNGGGSGENYITRRGNLTSTLAYADTTNPAAPSNPITETRTYDMAGNVIASSRSCCEQVSAVFELPTQYGFAVSETSGSSDPNSLLRVITRATYDLKTGLPLSRTNANGRTTQFTYYPNSLRPKEIISPTGARLSFEYNDAALKVTQTLLTSENGATAGKSVKYLNGMGQVRREEALGGDTVWDIVETVYDQFGRISRQSQPYRNNGTPQWTETLYDPAGRVKEESEPFINDQGETVTNATRYDYNTNSPASGAPGLVTQITDPWGRSRWLRLNSRGQLAEVVEPDPNGGAGLSTKYSYDSLGNLTRIEQGNQVRRFRYDSLGRLTHQKLAEAQATLNSAGDRATSEPESERWSDVLKYDLRSNLISRTDARGVRTLFSYKDSGGNDDPLNRLQSVSYDLSRVDSSLIVLPAPALNYQYRTKSSPIAFVDVTQISQVRAVNVSTEVHDFDDEGRLREKTLMLDGRASPFTLTNTYDTLGRTSKVTYPEQYPASGVRKEVRPTYDVASRINGLTVNNVDYASQLSYNAASQITSLAVGHGANQLNENYSYEAHSGLLSTQTVMRGSATLMSLRYQYRKSYCEGSGLCLALPESYHYTGQVTKVLKPASGQGKIQNIAYDTLGRLKKAEQGIWVDQPGTGLVEFKTDWKQDYSYDRYGNRTGVAASNTSGASPVPQDGIQSLSYDETSNRITTAGFSYDPAGNQTTAGSNQTFLYDAAGRLKEVRNQDGSVAATYTYGSSNRRLITQTGNESSTVKTYYIWQGDAVITEYTEPGNSSMPQWSRNYIYFGSRLLAMETPSGSSGELVEYHHPDRLGTRLVTNNGEGKTFGLENLPYGTPLDATSATSRRFTSYDRSATTGLDYAVNRHYDSRQGRFTQPDPIGLSAASLADPQSLNMYSYVGNDPINRVDPDGQFWGALFRFVGGLFRNLKPNIINGSFAYGNRPPVSVSFTTNFHNIEVGYAGFGVPLRIDRKWLPQLLFPKKSGIEFLQPLGEGYGQEGQDLIRSTIDSLKENERCTRAFEIVGLQTIKQTVDKGIVIGGSGLLRNPNNVRMLGIKEAVRSNYWKEFKSYNARGATIRQFPGESNPFLNPRDQRTRMFFSLSAFERGWGGVGWLRWSIIHEFIHAGGEPGVQGLWYGHDLRKYDWHDFLQDSCK